MIEATGAQGGRQLTHNRGFDPPGLGPDGLLKQFTKNVVESALNEEMRTLVARPLDEIYAAVFIDAIVVKVRGDQVANRPIWAAIRV